MNTIETKYSGGRIRACCEYGRQNVCVSVSYDHGLNKNENHAAAARTLAKKLKWTGTFVQGHTKSGCVFVPTSNDHIRA